MPKLTLLVGSPGSGKSTLAKDRIYNDGDHGAATVYINQDTQGKQGHIDLFWKALGENKDIIVDRMGFSKEQRLRYLHPAKEAGYESEIIVLHVPYQTCLERCLARKDHPTIKEEKDARSALFTFFGKYERVQDNEADVVTRLGWATDRASAIVTIDLDGTLCNIDHRLHYVSGKATDSEETQKKNWPMFFKELVNDKVNDWCADIMDSMLTSGYQIILASGRPDDHEKATREWLSNNNITYHNLFMRRRGDYRPDTVIKEIILDFEILPRGKPLFFIDDRKVVVDLWRSRGYPCLACAEGNF